MGALTVPNIAESSSKIQGRWIECCGRVPRTRICVKMRKIVLIVVPGFEKKGVLLASLTEPKKERGWKATRGSSSG